MGGLRLQMPIVKGDGHLGKAAIYDWERQSRHDQAAIKEYLDKEWHRKMQKKRDEDAGKELRQAAKTGDAETVGALIQAGVAVDHSDGDYGQTALHYAAREGRTGCIQVLLQHGANPISSPKTLMEIPLWTLPTFGTILRRHLHCGTCWASTGALATNVKALRWACRNITVFSASASIPIQNAGGDAVL